jgi:hypothetical protein
MPDHLIQVPLLISHFPVPSLQAFFALMRHQKRRPARHRPQQWQHRVPHLSITFIHLNVSKI